MTLTTSDKIRDITAKKIRKVFNIEPVPFWAETKSRQIRVSL